MNNQQLNNPNNETDIFILLTKFRQLIDKIGYNLYLFFKFVLRNIVVIALLFILGAVLGYFADKKFGQKFKHEIIVTPNFGSTDYLYERINDYDYKDGPIKKASIRPITDIYAFIKERYQNLEMAKYMSDNSIKYEKYTPNNNVENFHRYHLITLETKNEDVNGSIIDQFLSHFNQNKYFLDRQKIEKENLAKTVNEYSKSIENINTLLDKLGQNEALKNSNLEINTYSELFQLVNVKKSLIEDLSAFKVKQIEQDKVVYDTSRIVNIPDNKFPFIIIFPILFVGMYLGIVMLRNIVKKYSTQHKQTTNA